MAGNTKPGDKVRITAGPHAGLRATVTNVHAGKMVAQLEGSKKEIALLAGEITNFSAAARKAWKTMPARRVGRPAGKVPARTSVTLRIDKLLWARFQHLESRGYIKDRSETIEQLLSKKLDLIEETEK